MARCGRPIARRLFWLEGEPHESAPLLLLRSASGGVCMGMMMMK
jgi:hypothetical protein